MLRFGLLNYPPSVTPSGSGSGLALAAAALGVDFPIVSVCPIKWDWDTQADMFLALTGAVSALVLLGRAHDRSMEGVR